MQKQFVVFNRYSSNSGASKNSRIDTVCGNLGLNQRRVDADSDLNSLMADAINWGSVIKLQKSYQDKMRRYLLNSLNIKPINMVN